MRNSPNKNPKKVLRNQKRNKNQYKITIINSNKISKTFKIKTNFSKIRITKYRKVIISIIRISLITKENSKINQILIKNSTSSIRTRISKNNNDF